MTMAAAIKSQVEAALAGRVSAPFAQKADSQPEVFPTYIPAIDEIMNGGFPRGRLIEITGDVSAGRTGLAFSAIATATSRDAACGWVDVLDAFDPESAAAWGVNLQRLLWLRGGEEVTPKPQMRSSIKTRTEPDTPITASCEGMHPRNETRNMDHAVSRLFSERAENASPRTDGLLRNKQIATPGAANRKLSVCSVEPRFVEPQPDYRKVEQIASDRLPSRRGDFILRKPAPTRIAIRDDKHLHSHERTVSKSSRNLWPRLNQALRATDLLLQTGGFGVVVLDLSDVPSHQVLRIPLATWYRFRLAAEVAQISILLLTDVPCAKSCTTFLLRCKQQSLVGTIWPPSSQKQLFLGLKYEVNIDHQRGSDPMFTLSKKPSGRTTATWASTAR